VNVEHATRIATARIAALSLALAIVWPVLLLGRATALAQPHRRPPESASLEGLWTNVSATPLERPAAFDSLTTTEAKAAAFEKSSLAAFNNADVDDIGGRQTEWWETGGAMIRIGGQFRTSVIVDPADGKLPYTPAGRALMEAARGARVAGFDNPETRPSSERCLMGGSSSSSVPTLPHWDNSHYQIVQTPEFVVIRMESGRDPRIIRLREIRHLPPGIRPWMGDSIGHWEGRTLVVETTNLNPGEAYKSPQPLYISPNAKVTERFARISAGEILYDFTVDDPTVFARPWRGELLFHASKGPLYEFACHEGNYSLPGILAGARHEEQMAAKTAAGH
jgi:hypothetical protein